MALRKTFLQKLATLQKWRSDETVYTSLFVAVLNFLGLWTDSKAKSGRPSIFGKALTILWICILCPFFATIGFISSYRNHKNGDPIMKILEPALAAGLILLFFLYAGVLRLKEQQFVDALTALENMLECGRKLEEHPKDLARKAKKYADLCVCYYLGGLAPFILSGIGNIGVAYITKEFVFKAWFPFDFDSHPYFDLTTVAINVTIMAGFNLILLANCFLILHMVHAITQFKLLNHNLAQLNQRPQEDDTTHRLKTKTEVLDSLLERQKLLSHSKRRPKTPNNCDFKNETEKVKENYQMPGRINSNRFGILTKQEHILEPIPLTLQELDQRLKLCAKHHQSILDFVTRFQEAFDLLMLNQFIMSVAPTILAIVLVTSVKELDLKLILFALPLFASFCNQWLYCWLGQMITTESDILRDAIFGSNWFEMSTRFKHSMRIMMARSNVPLVIVVGTQFPLSLESFYSVIKLSYSSYMSLMDIETFNKLPENHTS